MSAKKRVWSFSNPINLLLIGMLVLGAGYYGWTKYANKPKNPNQSTSQPVLLEDATDTKPKVIGKFTGEEFRELYHQIAYPNTQYISQDAIITGNHEADLYIQKLAEDRGYVRRSAPVSDTFSEVKPGITLQQKAVPDWEKLKESAKKDEIFLDLSAGYRSSEDQRKIFLDRLGEYNATSLLAGQYDAEINKLLETTAIPGYSRHHTGYTIDITCQNEPDLLFENSICFDWLKENNYQNAKASGWIPSYPEGAGDQGPEPEAWEYVWVGIDSLYE